MNKKAVSWVIIGIVIVAVVVIGVVAYWALTSTGDGEPTPSPTPTPGIEDATSLQFDVSTSEKDITLMAKNLGTSEVMLRVEESYSDGSEFIYIINQAEQGAWANFDGSWTDVSTDFAVYWDDTWSPALDGFTTALEDWTGTGNYEYDSTTISNIEVNPTLADSLFQPD
jgi:hypothetical protein